jgi:hypothetical protein
MKDLIRGVTFETTPAKDMPRLEKYLESLPYRATVRLVWQDDESQLGFLTRCRRIALHADILACVCDSTLTKKLTLTQHEGRARVVARSGIVGLTVEILNEGGGDWLGPDEEVFAKARAAETACRFAEVRTAATLYLDGEDWNVAEEEDAPSRMEAFGINSRLSPDLALVSWYPNWTPDVKPGWASVFGALSRAFPKADLGFGEFGMEPKTGRRADSLIREIHAVRDIHPRFRGGYFYWDTATASQAALDVIRETLR